MIFVLDLVFPNSLHNDKNYYFNLVCEVTCMCFVGPTCRALVMNTEQPINRKISRPVSLCSLMPRKRGCSPGAALSDSSFRLLTWEMDSTVAATNHGKPIMEHTASITPTINKSRWYPQPFCRIQAEYD